MSKSKNVFITGGNRGIGLEMVKQILETFKPDNLFATCRDPAGAKVNDFNESLVVKVKKKDNFHHSNIRYALTNLIMNTFHIMTKSI